MSPEQFADQLPDQAQLTTRDNALAEPTIGLFKTEAIGTGSPFRSAPRRTVDDVEYATNEWVDWYSNRRLHSVLDYIPPEEYQTLYYAHLRHGALPGRRERDDVPLAVALRAGGRSSYRGVPPTSIRRYPGRNIACGSGIGSANAIHRPARRGEWLGQGALPRRATAHRVRPNPVDQTEGSLPRRSDLSVRRTRGIHDLRAGAPRAARDRVRQCYAPQHRQPPSDQHLELLDDGRWRFGPIDNATVGAGAPV